MISIVVPVYNNENFLSKCIESILAQSFKNFELLLIDDGSTDNSGTLCDKYSLIDKRIKVHHKKNAGVGAARNTGIEIANGQYITFIDSDDYIDSHFLECFFNIPFTSNNIYVRADALIDKQEEVPFSLKTSTKDHVLNNAQLGYEIEQYDFLSKGAPWAKLFSLELIRKYNLKFPTEINFHEDHYFVIRYITACAKEKGQFIYISTPQYHYVQHKCMSLTKRRRSTIEECKIFSYMKKAIDENSSIIKYNTDYISLIYTTCCFSSYISGIKACSNTEDYSHLYDTAVVSHLHNMKVQGRRNKFIKFILMASPKILFNLSIKIFGHII